MESEFFGHEKGAFTSADRSKQGLVELAREGTLFLDEIGDLDLSLQGKLLRLIEERRFKRVGGVRDIEADVRFIAATNRDLEEMSEEGKFREDLLYRLNVFQINLPPLRARDGDILLIARYFIQQFSVQMNKEVLGLDSEASQALLRYAFPGNVRQLRNMVEQAMILAQGKDLKVEHFPGVKRTPSNPEHRALSSIQRSKDLPLDQRLLEIRKQEQLLIEMEGEIINDALTQSNGNKTKAAQLLDISRYALQRRLRRMKI
jgi:two-component system response regulator AtoC